MPIDIRSSQENRETETQTIPLHVEELSISRRQVAGDTVAVRVVTHQSEQHIDEALHHERVEITRVPVGRTVDAVPPVREDGDVTIMSVVEEVVVVERTYRLVEEIHIRRVQTDDRHRETVMVRRQEAVITRSPTEGPRTEDGAMTLATQNMPKTHATPNTQDIQT